MLNIGYIKSALNEYILKYVSRRVTQEGQGLAFFYFKHSTQIVVVPTSSVDANLVFNSSSLRQVFSPESKTRCYLIRWKRSS
jgi:hypothetical protein